MSRVVAVGLSPNTEGEDVFLALKKIFSFWNYKKGTDASLLEEWFCKYFGVNSSISFDSGRGALSCVLSALGIGRGDEVIIQAFTCVVVPNCILAVGARPVYADVLKSFTLDPYSVESKITKKTKAIIVQHTFGIPTDMDSIFALAKKHNLNIIEDVAHTIGGEYKRKKLGTMGIASFFSFGRDKAFSSVFGGMAITNNEELGKKIRIMQKQKAYPSYFWIFQQLLHPIAFALILPLYDFLGLGKLILVLLQKLKLLSIPVKSTEKRGKFLLTSIKKFPNALSSLALAQVKKIAIYNLRRKKISARYKQAAEDLSLDIPVKRDSIPFLRFPLLFNQPALIKKYFRDNGKVYIGDWYSNIIDPRGSNFSSVGYTKGMCPNAEFLSKRIINLPTYPTMTDADVEKVVELLRTYVAG